VSRDELIAAVQLAQQQNPDQPVVISADKSVRYENVMDIMSLMQQNNVKRLGLLAKPGGK
jgi:biopolymer transport protein TolR